MEICKYICSYIFTIPNNELLKLQIEDILKEIQNFEHEKLNDNIKKNFEIYHNCLKNLNQTEELRECLKEGDEV